MNASLTTLQYAQDLDSRDELAPFRAEFIITEPGLIYLDGNSLGRLPKRALSVIQHTVEDEWGHRLIRSWNESWLSTPAELGAKIARLVGAREDEVIVVDSTSVNLFMLSAAALRARPDRTVIVSDTLNFPTDLYILQGLVDLLGGRHTLRLIPSADGIRISPQAVETAIDSDTALVCLTHVAFKSAFMYDMASVTGLAHQHGALMLWDLSHSVGAVPLHLDDSGVDLAVGSTYKYLNGGPGAPAFLYVRRDLQDQLRLPIWGWFSHKEPFAFALDYEPAAGMDHFRLGTPPMLSMKAIEPGLDIFLEAGMERVRAKSVSQTEYLIALAREWLMPLGFSLGSPGNVDERGSHVSLRHPEGYRVSRAMIESPPPALRVIPDFRAPDYIRLGITPLYTTYTDIFLAMNRVREIVEGKIYEQFSAERLAVT
jgi:kynureninase